MVFKHFHTTVTVSRSVNKHRVGHGNPLIKSSWPSPPQNGINYEFRPLETRFAPILGGMNEAGADDEARRVPGYHRPAAGTGRTRGPLVWLGFGKVGTDCHAEWAAAIWRF